jgi:hypothetical protein
MEDHKAEDVDINKPANDRVALFPSDSHTMTDV